MTLSLSTGVTAAWWAACGVGLVVAGVVWFLLEWLRRTVDAISEGVTAIWTMGKRVAQNTQTTHVLGTTKARSVDLLEELQRHAALRERGGR